MKREIGDMEVLENTKKQENADEERKMTCSKEEGKSILFYVFIGCFLAAFAAVIVLCLSVIQSRANEAQDVEEIMNTICAYFAEATDEEYDEIAEKIRHDLIFGKHYSEDKLKYIDYIPNTAEKCIAELEEVPYQVSLLALNTGQTYQLDVYEEGMSDNGFLTRWGYDEISETGIQVTADLNKGTGMAEIDSQRSIVSIHRMKTLFCDSCIREMLEVNENVLEPELILYSREEDIFYPIENGQTYQCGEYEIAILFNEQGNFEINVTYQGGDEKL